MGLKVRYGIINGWGCNFQASSLSPLRRLETSVLLCTYYSSRIEPSVKWGLNFTCLIWCCEDTSLNSGWNLFVCLFSLVLQTLLQMEVKTLPVIIRSGELNLLHTLVVRYFWTIKSGQEIIANSQVSCWPIKKLTYLISFGHLIYKWH